MKYYNSQKGQSIIELLIVLGVLVILSTVVLTSFNNSKKSLGRQNAALELKVSLERARSDSIKRRATTDGSMAHITLNNATSFTVFTDLNQNQTIETSESKQVSLANSDVKIVGTGLVFPIDIKFDRRGFMTATNGAGVKIAPSFTVCDNCTALTATVKNSNIISISPTGTVVMLDGGQALPIFQTPTLSAVSNSSQINSLAVVAATP